MIINNNIHYIGTGEMAWQLRICSALTEDLCLIPSSPLVLEGSPPPAIPALEGMTPSSGPYGHMHM